MSVQVVRGLAADEDRGACKPRTRDDCQFKQYNSITILLRIRNMLFRLGEYSTFRASCFSVILSRNMAWQIKLSPIRFFVGLLATVCLLNAGGVRAQEA